MGISMGGCIAIALTLKHTELVKILILVSTNSKAPNTLGRRLIFLLLEIPRRLQALRNKYPQPNYDYQHQLKASQNYNACSKVALVPNIFAEP